MLPKNLYDNGDCVYVFMCVTNYLESQRKMESSTAWWGVLKMGDGTTSYFQPELTDDGKKLNFSNLAAAAVM